MTVSRIISIVAAVFFAVMFAVLPGYVLKALALGFIAVSVVWAITGWTTTVYVRGGTGSDGRVAIREGRFNFDIGSLWALLAMALCLGGGFLLLYLLSLIPDVALWIG